MKILDVTHPGAAEHLTTVIQDVVAMGYDLLKIDFLFAGTFEGERLQQVTGMQAYNRALQIIRDAAGPETIILSVGSPPIAGFDQLDIWRLGPDVAVQVFDATWFFVPGVARTTAARWPYCRAILCDGDPPLLRNLPQNEINVAGWAAAFAGSALFLSDDLRNISPERWAWLTPDIVSTALTGEPAIPDPVPLVVPFDLKTALSDQSAQENRHEVPSRWSLTNGDTVYVNWSDAAQEIDGERVSPTHRRSRLSLRLREGGLEVRPTRLGPRTRRDAREGHRAAPPETVPGPRDTHSLHYPQDVRDLQ